ncbi:MAG: hypothetical protein GY723_07590 [bacterium]|nr:hypothetical protein [bacterium]
MTRITRLTMFGFILSLVPILAPGDVRAEEIPDRGPVSFSVYDKDSDGAISEEEFDAVRAERRQQRASEGRPMRGMAQAPSFSDFDANADGGLSPEELTAGQQKQQQERGGQGRGQGQGRAQGMDVPSFEDFDADGDAAITEQEFYDARSKRVAERAKEGRRMRNMPNAPAFSDIDTDSDGKLSPEEFAVHQEKCRQATSK